MILLNNIVQVFALPDFYTFVFICIVLLNSGRVGTTFVYVDQAGFTVGTDSFVQKAQGLSLPKTAYTLISWTFLTAGGKRYGQKTIFINLSHFRAPDGEFLTLSPPAGAPN